MLHLAGAKRVRFEVSQEIPNQVKQHAGTSSAASAFQSLHFHTLMNTVTLHVEKAVLKSQESVPVIIIEMNPAIGM